MKKHLKSSNTPIVRQCALALVLGGVALTVLLYLSSVVVITQCIPQRYFFAFTTVAICIATACSGMILSAQCKMNTLFCATVCAGCFLLLLLTAGSVIGLHKMSALLIIRFALVGISAFVGSKFGRRVSKAKNNANRKKSYT